MNYTKGYKYYNACRDFHQLYQLILIITLQENIRILNEVLEAIK